MGGKVSCKLIWLILITMLSACTESSSPDNGSDIDQSDLIQQEELKTTLINMWKDNGTTNGEEFSSRGKSTRIFVKENGKWLCIHGHYTLLL